MKNYFNLSSDEVKMKLNGSLEPLSDEQIEENQKMYGKNEIVEGKKKTTLQIRAI